MLHIFLGHANDRVKTVFENLGSIVKPELPRSNVQRKTIIVADPLFLILSLKYANGILNLIFVNSRL